MIKSMTGFGKAECLLPDKKLTIEIRTLNSKQMDSFTRLPSLYREKEMEIRQILSSGLERGKVECTLYYEYNGDEAPGTLNEGVIKNYYEQLRILSGELGLDLSHQLLDMVMRLPDTVRSEKASLDREEWVIVREGLRQAISQVHAFRTHEGETLEKDLRQHVEQITGKLNQLERFEKERLVRIRERISENLASSPAKEEIDENRFEQELIYYLEKLDISEEKVRLATHCDYFLETLDAAGPVGKKLAFISQEIGREINTLGSKAAHPEIQRLVVEMKNELEKIKEQVLNVL